VQLQWNMGVAQLPAGWLAVLAQGRRLHIFEVPFDPLVFSRLVAIASRFWHDHVLARVPPSVDAEQATTEALRAAYRARASGDGVELSPDGVDAALRWLAAKERVKAAKADLDLIENTLRSELGEATSGASAAGDELVTWRPQKTARRLDLEALEHEHPDLFTEFMVPAGIARVLRPTKALKALRELGATA
jgi:predicted phage-related endonuclease